jgi:tol-pal system protein YbgF
MKRTIIIAITCLTLMSGCALSRDVVYLDDRIDVIEKKISRQSNSAQDNAKDLKSDYAKMNNRFDNLADQIRQIEGRFEESGYAQDQGRQALESIHKEIERLDVLIADLTRRISHVEAYVGFNGSTPAEASAVKKGAASPSDPSATVPVTSVPPETQLYNEAQRSLERDDMKAAREGFAQLLKTYPNSSHADNAQFWIGESYYREKWYQKAILEYQKVIENYPKGNKIEGAYLKQGLAFFELGEADNGTLILNELIKKYPQSREAEIAKKKLASQGKK